MKAEGCRTTVPQWRDLDEGSQKEKGIEKILNDE
jgi:hypothetical protein